MKTKEEIVQWILGIFIFGYILYWLILLMTYIDFDKQDASLVGALFFMLAIFLAMAVSGQLGYTLGTFFFRGYWTTR
jgi:hypothetical protein